METGVNIEEGRTRALGKTLAPGGAAAVGVAAAVGLLAIVNVALSLYWSNEPEAFDVRQYAARFAERQARPVVVGTTTTATLVGVAEMLLDKPGGYLSNDRLPPGVLLDNKLHLHGIEAERMAAERRLTVSHPATSIQALCRGLGFAWVPREKIRAELDNGQLKALPLVEGATRWAELYLVLAEREATGPAARRLAELLREAAARCRAHADGGAN